MNKLIVIAALALAGSPALASKARVGALNNSRQLVDVQYAFERPYLLHSVGELATLEWGAKQADTNVVNPHAEGGFFKKSGDAVYGLYFGRKSDDFSDGVQLANTLGAGAGAALLEEQNPINVFYADKAGELTWGATVKYSNGSNDTGSKKVSTAGFAAGVTNGTWQAELIMGLTGKSEQTGITAESKGNTKIGVGYIISDMTQAYADYKMTKAEVTSAAGTRTIEGTLMHVGFINTLVKNDDANFFYGIAYSSNKIKDGDELSGLPVWMGIEANATSWMVFRASLQQNILINETKTAAGVKADVDSIAFNAGAGIKLGKGMLDASFGTASNGQFNYAASGFLTQAAYTYNF